MFVACETKVHANYTIRPSHTTFEALCTTMSGKNMESVIHEISDPDLNAAFCTAVTKVES